MAIKHLASQRHQQKDENLPLQSCPVGPTIWMQDLETNQGRRGETQHLPNKVPEKEADGNSMSQIRQF